jgi:oxygen-independent coproporphyrinogen-3 oxidase
MFVYVHLPFCLSRCIYCDFYVELKATAERRHAYLDALCQEIRFYLSRIPEPSSIKTLYLGGGTPGLFPAEEIQRVITCLTDIAPLVSDAEITMEINPERTASPCADYRAIGVNRLSMGIQSFQANALKRLSRVHSVEQAGRKMAEARSAKFSSISIDLMYGIPEQTQDSWQCTLNDAAALQPDHVSMYGLKVESSTPLAMLLKQGRIAIPDDDMMATCYPAGISFWEERGLKRYEISNLAKPGYESRHNMNYWAMGSFWGFGVSAHGYIQGQLYQNPRNLATYLADPTRRDCMETFTPQQQLENALIFGLRRACGVSLTQLAQQFGVDIMQRYGPLLQPFVAQGLIVQDSDRLQLTDAGILMSNEVLAVFI